MLHQIRSSFPRLYDNAFIVFIGNVTPVLSTLVPLGYVPHSVDAISKRFSVCNVKNDPVWPKTSNNTLSPSERSQAIWVSRPPARIEKTDPNFSEPYRSSIPISIPKIEIEIEIGADPERSRSSRSDRLGRPRLVDIWHGQVAYPGFPLFLFSRLSNEFGAWCGVLWLDSIVFSYCPIVPFPYFSLWSLFMACVVLCLFGFLFLSFFVLSLFVFAFVRFCCHGQHGLKVFSSH